MATRKDSVITNLGSFVSTRFDSENEFKPSILDEDGTFFGSEAEFNRIDDYNVKLEYEGGNNWWREGDELSFESFLRINDEWNFSNTANSKFKEYRKSIISTIIQNSPFLQTIPPYCPQNILLIPLASKNQKDRIHSLTYLVRAKRIFDKRVEQLKDLGPISRRNRIRKMKERFDKFDKKSKIIDNKRKESFVAQPCCIKQEIKRE